MQQIIITGVPEHFNFPWLKVVEEQPFLSEGIELLWKNEPKGSGAMNKAIREGSTDLALILTESFIKDSVEGNEGKIIGWYVKSPLLWGIHTSAKLNYDSVSDFQIPSFLISRYGSGSHLMSFLLAQREGWDLSTLKFMEIGDLEGAKMAFEKEDPSMFLWEKFTTKPLVDAGLFKRIGEIPTPWPCFVMVASKSALEKNKTIISKLRDFVYQKAQTIFQGENSPTILSEFYGIQRQDIVTWLGYTLWAENNSIKEKELKKVIDILIALKIISKGNIKPVDFVEADLVNWIGSSPA
ncbi:MAG: ABC transporter substrate-binding protein [Cecembia sp.]